jgi:hypothetical protein
MPLEFTEVEARLARKLGDPDLASALTRELQAHFAESLLSRLEAGYGQADALAATEKEFGTARQLAAQLAAPHQKSDQRKSIWVPALATCAIPLVVFGLYIDAITRGPVPAYLPLGLMLLAILSAFLCGLRSSVLRPVRPIIGSALGIALAGLLLASIWVPMGDDYMGSTYWRPNGYWTELEQHSPERIRQLDDWATKGYQAFKDPTQPVPPVYRRGSGYLTPTSDDSVQLWPKAGVEGELRIPALVAINDREEAHWRWREASYRVRERAKLIKERQEYQVAFARGNGAHYLERLASVGRLFASTHVEGTSLVVWMAFQIGSLIGIGARRWRRKRRMKAT